MFKRLFALLFVVAAIVFLMVPAFADEIDDSFIVDPGQIPHYEDFDMDSDFLGADSMLLSVSPDDATGFKKIMLQIIGDYEPVFSVESYRNNDNRIVYVTDITPDWPWICSFALFALAFYCLCRIGGAVLPK